MTWCAIFCILFRHWRDKDKISVLGNDTFILSISAEKVVKSKAKIQILSRIFFRGFFYNFSF